jgi:VanZ family protein
MTVCDPKWLRRGSGIIVLVYLTALMTGTHLPHPEELISIEGHDKWLHFGAYFGLAFLMAFRLWTLRPVTWRALLTIGALAAATGAADELTQLLPGINRHCEFADWLADLAGVTCGLLAWRLGERMRSRLAGIGAATIMPPNELNDAGRSEVQSL